MASVEAQVCNIALLRIGQLVQIADLGDNSQFARACLASFEPSRNAVLEARWWSFARQRASLAQLSSVARGPFKYTYSLPADCIAPRFIETGALTPGEGDDIPFEIELDTDGSRKVLLSNEKTVKLVYTAKVTAIGLWSPMAIDALAMKIAGDLALSVAKKPELGFKFMQAWIAYANAAASANANQRRSDIPPDSAIISSRT